MKRLGVKTVVILASAVFICGLVGALSDRSLITAVGIVIMGIAVQGAQQRLSLLRQKRVQALMSGAPVQNGPGRFLLQRGGLTAGES